MISFSDIPIFHVVIPAAVIIVIALSPLPAASENAAADNEWMLHVIDTSSAGADGVRIADVNGDGLIDIAAGWEQGGISRVYIHPGYANIAGTSWPAVTVGETPAVEDAVFADLDNDGMLDVISSCEGQTQSMFIHWAPSEKEDYLKPGSWRAEPIPASEGEQKWMFCTPMDIDGKHGIDLVAAGKGEGASLGWFEAPQDPHDTDAYIWHPLYEAAWIMSVIAHDMDGDGDLDILFSERLGEAPGCYWLERPDNVHSNWPLHFIGAGIEHLMFVSIADVNGDGLDDIIAAVRLNSLTLCIKQKPQQPSAQQNRLWEETSIPTPESSGLTKAAAGGDIDLDGDIDIVFTCEHADSSLSGCMWLEQCAGESWKAHDISGQPGIKYDRIELTDLDGDGDLDVLTTEENENSHGLGVIWYENPKL